MGVVGFQGKTYTCSTGESVLKCLTRGGAAVPSSCCTGVCQTCLMQATSGVVPVKSQDGLNQTLKEQGYFLACICHPADGSTLEVTLPGLGVTPVAQAVLISKEMLNNDIMRLVLECDLPESSKPGMFLNLRRPEDGLTRSYSIASLLYNTVEFHVRILPDGEMSRWLRDRFSPGDTCEVAGPNGNCFYTAGKPGQPMVLIGTGSGLAPLWGILNDALAKGHTGEIRLYHGSYTRDGLYLVDMLKNLSRHHENFTYVPCSDTDAGIALPAEVRVERADVAAMADISNLDGWRAYICGNPEMVKSTKRKVFLAGASMADIYADPFLLACR